MSQERAANGEWGAWRDAWLAEAPGAGAADAPVASGGADAATGPAVERSAPDGEGASAESPEPARHGST